MKKKFALRLFTALLFPVIIASCGKEEEQETVQPAADLVIDNSAVTLLQGDEITVSITSGNGDYSVKTFDESVATATIDGDKVTIKATENSVLDENNRAETTILVIDGRKKTARIKVQVAKLWDLTTDIPEEGIELFIGEKKTIEILTGNGDYKITMPEGAERYIKLDELSGQVFSVTAIEETPQGEPVQITITDKKQKTIAILIIVNIVDLTLKSNEATFAEPDAEVQTIEIEKGNGGYTFTFQTGEGEPTSTPTIVEATEEDNFITLRPLARGDVTVIVTDQKGSKEDIAIVYDGTQKSTKDAYQMYINGVKEELTPADNSYADVAPNTYLDLSEVKGDEALMIGRSGNSEFRLGYCNVAQARMWKTARTQEQIKEDMCKYYTPEEASANENLLGYWIPGNGIKTGTFKNYGSAGTDLDAKVYTQGANISETTVNADKFASTACPHTY